MLEIEMKFPIGDISKLQSKLTALPAKEAVSVSEADHYFNAPDRDFARTDEALRLRRIGDSNIVTYKGPKQAGITKTRTELCVLTRRFAAPRWRHPEDASPSRVTKSAASPPAGPWHGGRRAQALANCIAFVVLAWQYPRCSSPA